MTGEDFSQDVGLSDLVQRGGVWLPYNAKHHNNVQQHSMIQCNNVLESGERGARLQRGLNCPKASRVRRVTKDIRHGDGDGGSW